MVLCHIQLNVENKSGTGGKVINVFADVLKSLWLGSSSAITPRRFKEVVETFATQFQGYSQHDSQEFIVRKECEYYSRLCFWI